MKTQLSAKFSASSVYATAADLRNWSSMNDASLVALGWLNPAKGGFRVSAARQAEANLTSREYDPFQ